MNVQPGLLQVLLFLFEKGCRHSFEHENFNSHLVLLVVIYEKNPTNLISSTRVDLTMPGRIESFEYTEDESLKFIITAVPSMTAIMTTDNKF